MSESLVVEVCAVDSITPHSNADRLELAQIKGWQCVVQKGLYTPGSIVVYFPPNTMLPDYVSHQLGIFKYLKGKENSRRVSQIRLRGEPSFGVVLPLPDNIEDACYWSVGTDVAHFFGATKYEPPPKFANTDAMSENPMFPRYTNIDNLRNFPDEFKKGEKVVITEKIHGTNCRVGIIEGEEIAGSRRNQRLRPDDLGANFYWYPWTIEGVRNLLHALAQKHAVVVLYGETYGRVQSLKYGKPNGVAFAAFDLLLDGKYVDFDTFESYCHKYYVPTIPVLARGEYSLDVVKSYSDGNSCIAGAQCIKEGVVIRITEDRVNSKGGRLMYKYLSDAYLLNQAVNNIDQDTTDV